MPPILTRLGAEKRPSDYARTFEALGYPFHANGDPVQLRAQECPFCGGEKCHLNRTNGLYDCKSGSCGASGNVTTFLTHVHGLYLARTTAEDYGRLKQLRGIASQTLERHELAYMRVDDAWLIPFKSSKGNVVNLQRYWPAKPKPNKFMLPELPTVLYGFDKLKDPENKDKDVLLCEGAFDAMALDYSLANNRSKYVVMALPGAFKESWAGHFRDRRVRVFCDNDEAGRKLTQRVAKLIGETGIAADCKGLRWPDGFDLNDLNDLVRDRKGRPVLGWLLERCYTAVRESQLDWEHGWELTDTEPEVIEWVWPFHLRTRTYASLSGKRGSQKSTLIRELIARFTRGEPLPDCHETGLAPSHVIYITAEDNKKTAWTDFKRKGADMSRLTVLPALKKDGDCLNILSDLEEIRCMVRAQGTRWIVIDGQNSVVGAPPISTDMQARTRLTNKLHQFAQVENLCLLGVRNEADDGRAYGPASMNDLARCILRTKELEMYGGDRYFLLKFDRVNDAAPSTHPDIPYSVIDLGGSHREIAWGKSRPTPTPPAAAVAPAPAPAAGGAPTEASPGGNP
jgi:hypothetical protein